jgi:chemotaxis protein MotA
MELAWLIGLVGGSAFLVFSFFLGSGGNLLIYWDLMSVFTTVLGSFGALLIATPMERIKLLPKIIGITTKKVAIDPAATVETLVTFAEKARREGVLSLEDDVAEIPDPFLKKAIQLVVDGTDPEIVKNIMFNELDQMEKRHAQGKKMLDDWAYFAPAFGMIGTLQGLVAMLRNMTDVASIGANMATALITTLYGAIMANFLFLPWASRLALYNQYEVLLKEIMVEGVLSIQAGDNPTILRERLNSFVPADKRVKQEPKE